MGDNSLHHTVTAFIELLLVASFVAVVLQRFRRLPYTVTLVAVGMVLGAFDVLPGVHISPELVLLLFLPALLFDAAQHIEIREFTRHAQLILTLAVPGVIVGILVTGAGVYAGMVWLGLGEGSRLFTTACLVGAMVAATDPISVIALFRSLKVPPRLALLLEGESLFNDGTAIVFFGILLEAASGGELGVVDGIRTFVVVAFGGTAIGLAAGLMVERALRTTTDHLVELGLTVVLAYGVFLVAEAAHVSGVIAVVVAGMVNGNVGMRSGVNAFSRVALYSFWEFAGFVINSMVFLIMGITVPVGALWANRWPIVIATAAMLAARAASVYILTPLVGRFMHEPIPRSWHHILYWGGLRGSLSIVLALSLPEAFPHRELLIHVVFGIVVLSCFGQGLTIGPLLQRLGLSGAERMAAGQELRTRLRAHHAALDRLRDMLEEKTVSHATYQILAEEAEAAIAHLEDRLERELEAPGAAESELAVTEQALRETMRTAVLDAYHNHEISAEVANTLVEELAQETEAAG